MARRRRPKDHKERIHEEMLRHLDEHPLPPTPKEVPRSDENSTPAAGRKKKTPPKDPTPPEARRPRLMLRKLPLELALDRLERFVHTWRHQGIEEVIVVVGKGLGSPDGQAVLGPAVRDWLEIHGQLVCAYEEAPAREGGSGAILVRLRSL